MLSSETLCHISCRVDYQEPQSLVENQAWIKKSSTEITQDPTKRGNTAKGRKKDLLKIKTEKYQ